jgi:hypothetical protein
VVSKKKISLFKKSRVAIAGTFAIPVNGSRRRNVALRIIGGGI